MAAISHDIFKGIFLNENVWISIKFHWSLFLKVELKHSNIGSD